MHIQKKNTAMVLCFAYIHVSLNTLTFKSRRQHNKSFSPRSTYHFGTIWRSTEPTNGQNVHNLERKPCKRTTFY